MRTYTLTIESEEDMWSVSCALGFRKIQMRKLMNDPEIQADEIRLRSVTKEYDRVAALSKRLHAEWNKE